MPRIFAVADIHGMIGPLNNLLAWIGEEYRPGDQTVFLGDYIDRGSDSKDVVDLLLEYKSEMPSTTFLLGNHDWWLKRAVTDFEKTGSINFDYWQSWLWYGGEATLSSYDAKTPEEFAAKFLSPELAAHKEFFETALLEYDTEFFRFVHAGFVPPGMDPNNSWDPGPPYDAQLWIRNPFLGYEGQFEGNKRIVFGHTIQDPAVPLVMKNKIGLDLGCFKSGKLALGVFEDANFYYKAFEATPEVPLPYQEDYEDGDNPQSA